jgi:G3E family GTPase
MGIMAYTSPPSFQKFSQAPHHHSFQHDNITEHLPHNHDTHYEARGISSMQITCPTFTPLHLDRLDEWIRTVLWENQLPHGQVVDHELRVLRCKGLFTMQSGEQYVLQGVQNLYEISQVERANVTGVPEPGKLVLIGKGLDITVRHSLEAILN